MRKFPFFPRLLQLICLLCLFFAVEQKVQAQASGNPILQGYEADPDIQYFNGKYYIYPTGGNYFKAFSSTDLTNWVFEGVIFDLGPQCSWANVNGWAPHVVFRNNQYYFYYTAEAKIGVAVGPSPIGPFTDLGYPLIGSDPFITDIIDPAVFVDNDGQAYIYYGGSAQSKMVIRKLASNMTSFIGGPTLATPQYYTEAPHMLKRGSTYYLSYSNGAWNNSTYNVRYSTSTSPMGPWTYRGVILQNWGPFTGNGHASIMHRPGCGDDYEDEYFIVYHRYQNGDYTTRRVCIDRLYFTNALIMPVYPTWAGMPARPNDPEGMGCIVPNTVPNGTYRIVSKMTTANGQPLVLDIFNCSTSRSADIGTWTPTSCLGQRWQLTYLDGFYTIVSQQPTHYALDLTGCNINEGAPLGLWDFNGNPCQQYRLEPVGGGYYRIMNRVSSYVLDIGGCSNVPGADVTHWRWKGLDCQLWRFEPVSATGALAQSAPTYSIKAYPNPAKSELNIVMDQPVDGKTTASGTEKREFTYALYNSTGALVIKGENPKESTGAKVNIRNLPKGIYFLRVNRGGEQVEKQIIINNQ